MKGKFPIEGTAGHFNGFIKIPNEDNILPFINLQNINKDANKLSGSWNVFYDHIL